MAERNIAVKHIQRNDTRANWLLSNPILSLGEIGVETDTYKIKVGNGVNKYSDLPYFGVSMSEVDELLSDKVNTSQIKNNLTETVSGNVLDATQGKVLWDKCTELSQQIKDTSKGLFYFDVEEDGNLYVTYSDGDNPPKFSIDGEFLYVELE